MPLAAKQSTTARLRTVLDHIRAERPDVVVVQQHLPSAVRLARAARGTPVVLQAHNFAKSPSTRFPLTGRFFRWRRVRAYERLAGLIFVSDAVRERFEQDYPEVKTPRVVVPNGYEPDDWKPWPVRQPEVVCVGRAHPDKGLLEAAQAVAHGLSAEPGWHATFILAEAAQHPDYARAIRAALAPLGERASILENVPHAAVREANSRAAIALIPSKWQEPFGRTALEAHAGGAAVISSGSGGLREISGEDALFVWPVTAEALAEALKRLVSEPHLRAQLSSRANGRISQFTADRVAAISDEFIEHLARGANGV